MAKIKYIGNKETKPDNVAGTGVVWHGHGDIQVVPDSAVGKLVAHSGVWELVELDGADGEAKEKTDLENPDALPVAGKNEMTEADYKPPMANLETMDKDALREFAQRHFNHEFHHNAGEAKMRQEIVGLMNRG